ncbi:MAG: hypothetical protein UY00_C0002G0031, partial [Candidatus Wolfebacteria bacterium GW2011_GWA1_47_6]
MAVEAAEAEAVAVAATGKLLSAAEIKRLCTQV